MGQEDVEERDGSALCLSCGMCCRGMLHGWAALEPQERQWAVEVGLDMFDSERGPAFRLPCTRLSGNACEIYRNRPAHCAGYRCRLLNKSLDGQVTLDGAQAIVGEAKNLAEEVRALAGDEPFPALRARWRQGLDAFVSGDPATVGREQRAYLMISVLCAFLDRHMVAPHEPGLLEKSAGSLEKRAIDE